MNVKVIDVGTPQRGDVMVFRYPMNTSLDYIKRVVALPGDRIVYRDKRLSINDREVTLKPDGSYSYLEGGLNVVMSQRFTEQLGEHMHAVLVRPEASPLHLAGVRTYPFRENCAYNDAGFSCTVPAGHYFLMGDNRDASDDSRYWGFVPDRNIVGKAFMIWWNFDELQRIGQSIR